MAHFLPGRVGLETGQCGLHSFHWQVFAKQALTTHCDHMEEGLSPPWTLLTKCPGGAAYTRHVPPPWPATQGSH